MPEFIGGFAYPHDLAPVVNPEQALGRPPDMTKSPRKRGPDVLELVDEPTHGGSVATVPAAPAVPIESFEDFYRREYPRLLMLARVLAGDAAAEDIAQESMLVTYRQWTRIALLGSPAGYVRGICAHKAVSWTRRLTAERRALGRVAARRTVGVEPLAADSDRFWAEVRRLPRRQAQVTALFYALDLPVAAVSVALGCAEGTVKVHLSRARAELGRRLATPEEQS
jgi:DNA-directed RNA polymerase specialized sigma24 family protein